ncbi:ribosome silencing factor [Natranaerobius trueperi]|uniref:Ribosomal silencing factor RsfS n=1 Tax=Natranaerobius trueperi TaxID=759412 RepID=A0A226BY50_9FIRM|nr:ribosome silencing factor [Natranaerobius trueperi]OWZ83936.1 ribosome silencing factor [Natranaerobius trueperi]
MVKESFELVKNIVSTLDNDKGKDILIQEVNEITLVSDYFVLVTGNSTTHVQSLAENLIDTMKQEKNISALHKEGITEGNWALIDFDSVVVHIFLEETRSFYNLERLWAEANEITINELDI